MDFLREFFGFWQTIFVVLALLIALAAALNAVLTKADSRSAAMWVAVVVMVPFIGGSLYFLFGRNRIERRAVVLRRGQKAFLQKEDVHEVTDEELERMVLGNAGHQFLSQAELVGNISPRPLVGGNSIEPLECGEEAYPAMLDAIETANSSISMATYIFDHDPSGIRFADALGRAVERGVEVRVLIDDAGARYSRRSIVKELRARGVRVGRFLPTFALGRLLVMNLRNHRKLLVIDGKTGFTGGMNIRHGNMLSESPSHPIRDVHFRINGPVVCQLQDAFAEDWCFTTGEALDGAAWYSRLDSVGDLVARGIQDGPDMDHDKLALAINGAVGSAQESVHIATPYFLPEAPMISALNLAALRGVEVHIIVPEKNNIRTVGWACDYIMPQLLSRGVRIWKSPPPFDHSKIFVVDSRYSLVGSTNLDPRSLRLNFEFNLECYSADFAEQLEEKFIARRESARELDLSDFEDRSLPVKLRDGTARLIMPFL